MANGQDPGPIHHQRTRLNNLEYCFYVKHHQSGPSNDAQWLAIDELTREQEFEVFDFADLRALSDEVDNLYGMRPRDDDDVVPKLGTRGEQVAKFPFARENETWHGYPLWPIAILRDGERLRPTPNDVLLKMVNVGLITCAEQRRLRGGKHI